MKRSMKRTLSVLAGLLALTAPGFAAPPSLRLALSGEPQAVFVPARDGCDGNDVPDVNARAYRDSDGRLVVFALHDTNRALRGASLDALKIDCRITYKSGFRPDPAAYDDQSWIAATWTPDGRRVAALVHHEYHADRYGRCHVAGEKAAMGCWFNTIIGAYSADGGASFTRMTPAVVASAPFAQDREQGRHRGFFNPSNILAHGGRYYMFAAQTGWNGQPYGVCAFRSDDPLRPGSWRAWDGRTFSIRYDDPYRRRDLHVPACRPVAPFPAQIGAIVRHRASGTFVAVVQAWKDDGLFPLSGFYYATSRDLLHWSEPRLLMATKTLYDNACGAGRLNSYPSILDPASVSRNFDDAGDSAFLYWSSMRVDGCVHTSDRILMRRVLRIEAARERPTP